MDFRLSEEQIFIRDTARRFAARELSRDAARALDEARAFPAALLEKLAATGFCALNNPEAYGGAGRNLLGAAVVVEELASLCPALAGAYARIALMGGRAISELGSEAQQAQYLPEIARGALIFTAGLAGLEADDAETDAPAAAREGDGFSLTGVLAHVPLARQARFILTPARLDAPDAPPGALAFFIVDAAAPGVRIAETERVGLWGAGLGQITLENARVPAEAALGGAQGINRGAEHRQVLRSLEHIETAGLALGLAQGAFDYAAEYAKQRSQFGQPIIRFEAIQHLLVDIGIGLRAARHLLYEACWLADEGQPFALEAAVAKTHAVELARTSALRGLHILGGYGFMMEYDAQRYVRDALALLGGSEAADVFKSEVGALMALTA